MMKKVSGIFLLIISLITSMQINAQDSSRLRISLLTCSPGEELYSIFGHSALRVIDSNSVSDIVFNYGTFDFNDPDFLIKFTRGKLLYYVSTERFEDFKAGYQYENRGITEQVLDLSEVEKRRIIHALHENLKEENRYYKYDFFLDNCTTRLRDLIVNNKNPVPVLPAVMPEDTRLREAIHLYLDKGKQYWSKLGIDILLGSPTDDIMTSSQQQFLPDNLMIALNNATNTRIVSNEHQINTIENTEYNNLWITPMLAFSILLFIFLLLSLSKNKKLLLLLSGLEGALFFITGLLGILLIFMMTGTDHSMTRSNYNIFWAWPTHIIAAFFINKKSKWVRLYFMLYAIFLLLLLLSWAFLPQQLNVALIPLVLILLYRSATKFF